MAFILKSKTLYCTIAFLFILFATMAQTKPSKPANPADEIMKVEKQFEYDLNAMGAEYAFEKYAAPNAVIKRENDSLIYGVKAIKQYYSADIYKTAKANWTPDYIDISKDGTMAYTYGKYHWKMVGKSGKPEEYSGVFHTVWKKQADGTWKYVWD